MLQRFELDKFSFTLHVHIELWHMVSTLINQHLLDSSVYPFNTLQLAFSYIYPRGGGRGYNCMKIYFDEKNVLNNFTVL